MSRSKSTVVFLVGAAALALVVLWFVKAQPAAGAGGGPPPYVLPVTLATVERGSIAPHVQLTGSVSSARHARMGFEVAGRIAALAVDAGDSVATGTVLARLDERDAQATLAVANAAADLAQKQLDLVLAGARDEEKLRLAAELDVRKADAELARKDVSRSRDLVEAKVISQGEFDRLVAALDAATARVGAAEQALAQAQAGWRTEDIAVQRAQLAMRQADVAIAKRTLEKTTLVAPFDCAVVARSASLGDSVTLGRIVFELVDLSQREIQVEIPGSEAARLGAKSAVVITLEEFPSFELRTDLDAVVAAADEQTRSFRGIVRLSADEDRERRLKPGMFARVDVALEPMSDALLVPADAVRVVPSGTIVVRAQPGEGEALNAQWVPVRVLGSAAGKSAVEAMGTPLTAGERIVVIGVDLAFPSAPLLPRATEAAAAPDEKAAAK